MKNKGQLDINKAESVYDQLTINELGKWPDESELPNQMIRLAKGVVERIRRDAIDKGVDDEVYSERLAEARGVINDLCYWSESTEYVDKEEGAPKIFWRNRFQECTGLRSYRSLSYEAIKDINSSMLEDAAWEYYSRPYMWTERLSCLIVDALVLSEIDAYSMRLLSEKRIERLSTDHWITLFGYTLESMKWAFAGGILFGAYLLSKELFLALAIALTALVTVLCIKKKESKSHHERYLWARMVIAYQFCDSSFATPRITLEALESPRKLGAMFPKLAYQLLEFHARSPEEEN